MSESNVWSPSKIEMDLSHLTDHLVGEVLTLIDAVIEKDRQCEKTKDTIRQFFANYREAKWNCFMLLREKLGVELPTPDSTIG